MQPMIEVNGISKSYRLGARQNYATLREEVIKAPEGPVRRAARPQPVKARDAVGAARYQF